MGITISLLSRMLMLPELLSVSRSARAYGFARCSLTASKSLEPGNRVLLFHLSSVTGLHWHASAIKKWCAWLVSADTPGYSTPLLSRACAFA